MGNKSLDYDAYLPMEVRITKREQESQNVFTLHLELTDPEMQRNYHVLPGQFNMLYAYGVGEVPISVVSDVDEGGPLAHSIRALGGATLVLSQLKVGDCLGLRGPFGRGWPLQQVQGKDVIVVTGGIGSAPVITAVNDLLKCRSKYGRLSVLHGISLREDFIYQSQYKKWALAQDTEVLLACSGEVRDEGWHQGLVTDFLDKILINDPTNTVCFMCGPRLMMRAVAQKLLQRKLLPEMLFLSLERNMQCGLGHCGHCQCGDQFVCQDGPVFSWDEISPFLLRGL